jgi:branched-chain amino acid transport system ATP-binding protein
MSANGSNVFLDVANLVAGYGKKQIINGVSLSVGTGEIVALIGHNGAGKSTLLKAVFGLIPIWSGELYFNGALWRKPAPRAILRTGVAYVPQGNRVFTDLTVRENLEIGGVTLPNKQSVNEGIERVFTLFPMLKDRLKQRAGTLSGGEKQMLSLAPLVSEALKRIKQINQDFGVTVLIVEQKVREVLKIAHRVVVLRTGRVSFNGPAAELLDDTRLKEVFL